MKKYVLVIGASSEAYRQIRHHLEDSETEVLYSTTIDDAVFQLSLHRIALVVMEHGYACSDSQVLYQTLRAQIPIPILVLYANAGTVENNGVTKRNTDDVLSEVFDMGNSIAQAKSYIERYTRHAGKNDRAYIIACGQNLVIDPNERAVYLCGENLNLSQKQFDLLFCLASHPGQVLSKEQLFNYLWGEPDVEVNNSIVLYISKLRKKLGENPNTPEYIQTVRGIGYRFSKV